MKIRAPVAPANAPYLPPPISPELVYAIQGLFHGKALENQQKMVLAWIIDSLCKTHDLPYLPESQRDTDFALGKVFVGRQLIKLVKMTPEQISRLEKIQNKSPEDHGGGTEDQ